MRQFYDTDYEPTIYNETTLWILHHLTFLELCSIGASVAICWAHWNLKRKCFHFDKIVVNMKTLPFKWCTIPWALAMVVTVRFWAAFFFKVNDRQLFIAKKKIVVHCKASMKAVKDSSPIERLSENYSPGTTAVTTHTRKGGQHADTLQYGTSGFMDHLSNIWIWFARFSC